MNLKAKDYFFIVLNSWTILGVITFAVTLVGAFFGKIDPKLILPALIFVGTPFTIGLGIEINEFLNKITKALDKYIEERGKNERQN